MIAARLAPLPPASRYDESDPVVIGSDRFFERYEFGLGGHSTVARTNHSFKVNGSQLTGEVTFGLANEGSTPGITSGPWIAYVLTSQWPLLVPQAAGWSHASSASVTVGRCSFSLRYKCSHAVEGSSMGVASRCPPRSFATTRRLSKAMV